MTLFHKFIHQENDIGNSRYSKINLKECLNIIFQFMKLINMAAKQFNYSIKQNVTEDLSNQSFVRSYVLSSDYTFTSLKTR